MRGAAENFEAVSLVVAVLGSSDREAKSVVAAQGSSGLAKCPHARACKTFLIFQAPAARVSCAPIGPAAEQRAEARLRNFWKTIPADFALARVAVVNCNPAAQCAQAKEVVANCVPEVTPVPVRMAGAFSDLATEFGQVRGGRASDGTTTIPIASRIAINGKIIARIAVGK